MYKVRIDPEGALGRALTEIERKRLPFALSLAVNRVAEQVFGANRTAVNSVFDRPARPTRNAIRYRRSNYRDNPIEARVWVEDFLPKGTAPDKYLLAHALGGKRADKRSERALKLAGILGPNEQTAHAKRAKLNAEGNLPGSTYTQILSRLGALGEQGYQGNQTERSKAKRGGRGRQYFVQSDKTPKTLRRKQLWPGIYLRQRRGVKLVLAFVKPGTYRKRYDIFSISQKVFDRRSAQIFTQALEEALQPRQQQSRR